MGDAQEAREAAGALAIHLVGEVDMTGWEPPTYERIGTVLLGAMAAAHWRCSTCGATVTHSYYVRAVATHPIEPSDGRPDHTAYHHNLAEMMARFANALTKLGCPPFLTITNADLAPPR